MGLSAKNKFFFRRSLAIIAGIYLSIPEFQHPVTIPF